MRAETRAQIVRIFEDAVKVIATVQRKHCVSTDNLPILFGSTALFYHIHSSSKSIIPIDIQEKLELRLDTSKKDIDVGYQKPVKGMIRKQRVSIGSRDYFVDISFNHVKLSSHLFGYDTYNSADLDLLIHNPLQLYCGRLLAFCERQRSAPILKIGDKKPTLDANLKMLIDVELLELTIGERYRKVVGHDISQFLNTVWHEYYQQILQLREAQIRHLVQNAIQDIKSRYPTFTQTQIKQLTLTMQKDLRKKLIPEGRSIRQFIVDELRALAPQEQ